MAPKCSNCGASDFVWANELKTGSLGAGTLSLRSRGEIPVGTRICRACGHADLFLRDLQILHKPHLWRPGEFIPIPAAREEPKPAAHTALYSSPPVAPVRAAEYMGSADPPPAPTPVSPPPPDPFEPAPLPEPPAPEPLYPDPGLQASESSGYGGAPADDLPAPEPVAVSEEARAPKPKATRKRSSRAKSTG